MSRVAGSKYFVDQSIISGWLEFRSPIGPMRAENLGGGMVGIYCGSTDRHGRLFYAREATVRCHFSPKSIWKAYDGLTLED